MKRKIQIILAACMAVMLMTACGDDDETLGTEYQDPTNNFIPNPSANDDTSVLRREFKEKYGSYLLFTDTLQHYQIGIDVNGDPKYFTELLNILYAVGQSLPLTDTQKYTYFTDIEEQRKVVDYMDQYILNHITGKLRPTSVRCLRTAYHRGVIRTGASPLRIRKEDTGYPNPQYDYRTVGPKQQQCLH